MIDLAFVSFVTGLKLQMAYHCIGMNSVRKSKIAVRKYSSVLKRLAIRRYIEFVDISRACEVVLVPITEGRKSQYVLQLLRMMYERKCM